MSKYLTICPICRCVTERDILSGPLGLEEEHIHCVNCNYTEIYEYGYSDVAVGNKVFSWDYRLRGPKYAQLMKKLERAKFMARRNWKKFKRQTCVKF